ncbi:MAG: hypothetical protein ACE14V_03265 [bacterium]
MTKRDVLSIAFKIIGVYFISLAILSLSTFALSIAALFQPERDAVFGSYGTSIIMIIYPFWLLGFAYVFFRFGDSITELLLPDDAKLPELDINRYHKPIFRLTLRIFGVYCLVRGIPEIAGFIVRVSQTNLESIIYSFDFGNAVSGIILLVLGGYLITGGKRLVEFAFKEKPIKPNTTEPDNS